MFIYNKSEIWGVSNHSEMIKNGYEGLARKNQFIYKLEKLLEMLTKLISHSLFDNMHLLS